MGSRRKIEQKFRHRERYSEKERPHIARKETQSPFSLLGSIVPLGPIPVTPN